MAAAKKQLTVLREQREAMALKAEIATLERFVRGEELSSRLVESEWGELVNRREFLTDTPGWGNTEQRHVTRPSDRQDGRYSPIFETEFDLAGIRGIGRTLAATEVGAGIIGNLANFTIGPGCTYKFSGEHKQLNAAAESALEECYEANGWWEASSTGDSLESELFIRSLIDGEAFTWITGRGAIPEIRVVEPDYVTEPASSRQLEDMIGEYGLNWLFGIATEPGNPQARRGYFVQWEGQPQNWDYVPAAECVHIRNNVPRGVKRGVSDFYDAFQTLERASKLMGNTLHGAAIQACIAYIREAAPGTSETALTNARASAADFSASLQKPRGGTKEVFQEKFYPGKVISAANVKFQYGPLGSPSGPVFVDIVQAALRLVGSRWNMPEYMVSGDASNANYASTLVSGGPFHRATERRQRKFKGHFAEIAWKCLGYMAARGRFRQFGIATLRDLKQQTELAITAPEASIANRLEDEQIREIRARAGVLSRRTWAGQVDLDYEIEVQQGAKAQEPGMGILPGQPAANPATTPVAESKQAKLAAIAAKLFESYP